MKVKLAHGVNPDIQSGYWTAMKRPGSTEVDVASLGEASQKCMDYIEQYDLGGGNWAGGQVYENGKQIARISYNGRVWDMTGNEIELYDDRGPVKRQQKRR